jgi:hypothetical protein
MAAHESLSPQQFEGVFYHSSKEDLAEGTVVPSTFGRNMMSKDQSYAESKAKLAARSGSAAHVYEMKPESWAYSTVGPSGNSQYMAKKGFSVTKRVSSHFPEEK